MKSQQIKVLLIEDNPGDARLIQEMLNEANNNQYNLECFDTLSTGLEGIAEKHIDVILSDMGLPDSQGLDTLIKILSQISGVPVIVLTNLDDKELAINAIQQGAHDYLVKGQVNGTLLVRSIRYAIERGRLLNELEQVRQREKQRGEIESLDHMSSSSPSTLTAAMYGIKLLKDSQPDIFNELVQQYGGILDEALMQKNYKIENNYSIKLIQMADKLGFLRVGPREVVSIHTKALMEKNRDIHYKKAQANIEEGRLLILELMGNLVSFYRNYYMNITRRTAEHKPQKGTQKKGVKL